MKSAASPSPDELIEVTAGESKMTLPIESKLTNKPSKQTNKDGSKISSKVSSKEGKQRDDLHTPSASISVKVRNKSRLRD